MSGAGEPREEYGHLDPWREFPPGTDAGADYLYAGDHEVIEDVFLLTEVCVAFEHWADDFRYWDRQESGQPGLWEQESPFGELSSKNLANQGAEQ